MVDVVESARGEAPAETKPRRPLPSWVITIGSLVALLGAWEILGRDINPVFGSYPSAIAEAFWQLARTGKLWTALLDSLRPFLLGYGLAIVVGIPIGLVTGRFRAVEAAIGIYITAGYAMPLVALVPGRAVVAMVIAEFFTSISGLGAIIITSANNFDTATMFVPIVVLMVMAIGLNYLIGVVERWVAPWQAEIAGREE